MNWNIIINPIIVGWESGKPKLANSVLLCIRYPNIINEKKILTYKERNKQFSFKRNWGAVTARQWKSKQVSNKLTKVKLPPHENSNAASSSVSPSSLGITESFRSGNDNEDEYSFCSREVWYFVFVSSLFTYLLLYTDNNQFRVLYPVSFRDCKQKKIALWPQ